MRRPVALLAALALMAGLIVFAPPTSASAATISGSGAVYAGIYSEQFFSATDFDALAAASGKRTTFGGTFHSVNENDGVGGGWSNTRELLNEVWKGKATPFANLSIPDSAGKIASGAWDSKINVWASHLEQYLNKGGGRSLVLAPLQEMNGNWVPYGCDPGNFKNAFRRIVDIFRGRGIDETKVRFSFAPNGWTPPGCGSIADYYPGDAYVDVIGISAYRWDGSASVYQVMGATVDQLTALYPNKPIVIAQTAAWPSGTKDQWIRDMFGWAGSHPSVVAIVYFNLDQSGVSGETDWRVWIPPTVNAGWRDGMLSATTAYEWPLTDWFQAGPLTLESAAGTNLCPVGKNCDTVAFQDGAGKFYLWANASSGVVGSSFYFGNPGGCVIFG